MNLILASASPRRKELIRKIEGLHVKVVPSKVVEHSSSTSPAEYAMSLARLKAEDVFEQEGGLVLGADTVVVLGNEILEKPRTIAEAEEMFRKLCGKTHEVITGLCIMNEKKQVVCYESSSVTFGEYNEPIVQAYILSGAPFDKAGGYGIQDKAISPIVSKIEGDIDNVIGLPIKRVEELLRQF